MSNIPSYTFPFHTRKTEAFALISASGHPMLATIRKRKKDVPGAAREWAGVSMESIQEFGYTIGKVWIITELPS